MPAASRGWAYWLGWFTVAPINMFLASAYIIQLFKIPTGPDYNLLGDYGTPITVAALVISVIGLLVMFVPSYLGIHLGAGFATVLGVVSMAPLTALVFLPFFRSGSADFGNVSRVPPAGRGHRLVAALGVLDLRDDLVGARDGGGRLLHRGVPGPGPGREDRDDGRGTVRLLHLRDDPADVRRGAGGGRELRPADRVHRVHPKGLRLDRLLGGLRDRHPADRGTAALGAERDHGLRPRRSTRSPRTGCCPSGSTS